MMDVKGWAVADRQTIDFHRTHDGLEREIKFFSWLEGGVSTTCAPGDQEKPCDSQCEQAFRSGCS